MYDWGALSRQENRQTDRDRVRREAQMSPNRRKRKFRGKKNGYRIFNPAEADRYLTTTRSPRDETYERRIRSGQLPLGPAEIGELPMVGGGVARQAATGLLRNLPGIGRYLGRTDAGVGRFLSERSRGLARILPWLGGVAGGVALERFSDWGLNRLGEPGNVGRAMQVPVNTGGGPVMQQSPLGPLSQGQEFPGGPFVVKTWDTYPGPGVTGGGQWPIFALLSDGRIVVAKPNGSWKVYRPKKNLVISSNPRLRDIRKLDRMHKRVTGMMKRMVPRPARRK